MDRTSAQEVSSALAAAVIDAAPDGMVVVEVDGIISFANQRAGDLFGVQPDQLVGTSVEDLLPEAFRTAHQRHRARYLTRPNVRPMGIGMLLQARRRDGSVFPVEVSLSPLVGEEYKVVAAVRDVSARTEAEERMRQVLASSEEAVRGAERAMAVAEDRERIARDLHDTVIQRLFAGGLALEAIRGRVEPDVDERLDGIIEDLDQTIREIRTSIFALEATTPTRGGLRGEILEVVRAVSGALGFEPRLQMDGPIETIDAAVAEQLLPTLREALANAAKHADARSVRVIVETDASTTTLTVLDDGVGLAGEVLGGHGLRNIAARAAQLGGELVVEGLDPSGTRLRWFVPAVPPTATSSS